MKFSPLKQRKNESPASEDAPSLSGMIKIVSETCNDCGLCLKRCEFLRRFGTPKKIADTPVSEAVNSFDISFACSLCGLCTAVCPRAVNPVALFREMRRAAVALGTGYFPAHKRLLTYEDRGVSPRYSWYGFPEGCETVFFPGCTLPGTRPGQSLALFKALQQHIPALGIALDCCTKSSHDLGRTSRFNAAFGALKTHFLSNGIRRVITACPNCHQVFMQHGAPLHAEIAYDLLLKTGLPPLQTICENVTVHDPCVVRFKPDLHTAVRQLIEKAGRRVVEMPNSGRNTLCCGEGGAVGHLHPDLSSCWAETRRVQAEGLPLLTYCAGCAGALSRVTPARHILDLLFAPNSGRPFSMKVRRPPMTYWSRLRLKRFLKRDLNPKISGTRPFDR